MTLSCLILSCNRPGPISSPLRAVTLNSCAELTYEVKKKTNNKKNYKQYKTNKKLLT